MSNTGSLIRKYQLFKIGRRLEANDFTGSVILTEDEGTTTISFANGEPVRAASTLVSLSFPAFLLRKRKLERPQLKELLEESARDDVSLEEVLERRNILSGKVLLRLKRELSEYVFATAFHKDRVPYAIEPGSPDDVGDSRVRTQLPLHEALFRAVATDKNTNKFSRMFKDRWDVPLERSADFYRYLLQFRAAFYGEDITEALLVDGLTAQVLVNTAGDKEAALRQLFALTYAGMLSFAEGEAKETAMASDEPVRGAMEEVEENRTLVFMPDEIPVEGKQTVFLGSAMPFQSEEAEAAPTDADQPDRPEDLEAFLRDGFAASPEQADFEEEMLDGGAPSADENQESVVEPTPAPVAQAPEEEAATESQAEEIEVPALFQGKEASEAEPPEEEQPQAEGLEADPELATDDESEVGDSVSMEELLHKAVDDAQKAVVEPQPVEEDEPAEPERPADGPKAELAYLTPPPPPPRPKNPEQGTDASIERILEDVYRSMLSRDLYQVLGVANTTPLSAIRDAAARLSAKYSVSQYKGYMLSSRAQTLLEYVQKETDRALLVLTSRGERAAYDKLVGTQYDAEVDDALAAIFDAEDSLLQGLKQMREERWSGALESFSTAADLNSRDPEYLAYQGWATYQAYKSGQVEDSFAPNKARTTLERALAIDARNARALLFIARIEKDLNNMEAARVWYERLNKFDPNNDEVKSALEWLRMSAGIARRDQSGFWNRLKGIFIKK